MGSQTFNTTANPTVVVNGRSDVIVIGAGTGGAASGTTTGGTANGGTAVGAIVSGGAVVDGPPLNVATIDFLAQGGDQYPFRGAPYTTLGVTYQLALANYIEVGLSGLISAADYPWEGEDRIVQLP